MDSDEFDDDIADEDFLTALDQVSSSMNGQSTAASLQTVAGQSGNQRASAAVAALELEDLPSDAFSSPEQNHSRPIASAAISTGAAPRTGLNRASSGNWRQTTLFGGPVANDSPRPPQPTSARVFRADLPREEPTHHEVDHEAMKTWVFPTNLGKTRDYQFSIVKNSLFNNTLVALPTGLGKTFIAASVMLNFYRWTKNAKIVFVAPTKPLVAQQVTACYGIAGIPRSETTLLTGEIPPLLRVDEWAARRVFFMTPQTVKRYFSWLCGPQIYRAVGHRRGTSCHRRSFRVLALTATPGSKIETVQEVIDNLGISHCEIRTEDSIDIRQYVHSRTIEQVVLDPSDEMVLVSELFTKALKPMTDKLSSQNIWFGRSPMAMTTFGLMQSQKEWFNTGGRRANQGVQHMMRAVFTVLTSIAHSIKLLNFHGIKPFYDNLADMRSEQEGKGEKGSKYKRQLVQDSNFQEMMDRISKWLRTDGFVGHPKLAALADTVLNHFMDNAANTATRVIVFSEYRDSAEDIVRMLNKHRPLIKARVFVGQADSKRGEGMKQAQQIEAIGRFKEGEFNVLVATSIGEEGLDIGQVDLIVCYDSSASPIRMLQRMGRTGRKQEGKIVLLLMRGKEEEQFARSKDNYEKMQSLICEGSRFSFRFDLSTRIVPREFRPEVDMRRIDIPIENTQDPSLPEPKKRRAPAGKKKPPKKFHMPDGVETGFQSVASMLKVGGKAKPAKAKRNPELDDLSTVPELAKVLLSDEELKELNRAYRDLPFNHSVVEEADMPDMTAYPELQRQLRPVAKLKHGTRTKSFAKLWNRMGNEKESLVLPCRDEDTSNYLGIPVRAFAGSDPETDSEMDDKAATSRTKPAKVTAAAKKKQTRKAQSKAQPRAKRRKLSPDAEPQTFALGSMVDEGSDEEEEDDEEDEEEEEDTLPKARGRSKPGAKAKGKRKAKRKTGGFNSDEVGDDCDRDSDLLDTDGSDDGEDLLDFVVSDNHPVSSMKDPMSLTCPSTFASSPIVKDVDDEAAKPFFVPTMFSATQESEDLPDLGRMLDKPGQTAVELSDDDDVRANRTVRGRRNVVYDSDTDL
ncbi:hypothetical protein NXS19_000658 [Fusarium pseudograminearum]|nr:hypothetical protein NXS19_000658 [Fusarium pseudograminearum]